jgi:hypothetical protein
VSCYRPRIARSRVDADADAAGGESLMAKGGGGAPDANVMRSSITAAERQDSWTRVPLVQEIHGLHHGRKRVLMSITTRLG